MGIKRRKFEKEEIYDLKENKENSNDNRNFLKVDPTEDRDIRSSFTSNAILSDRYRRLDSAKNS